MTARELTLDEKARSVLCQTGRPGNEVEALASEEVEQLGAIYDECCAPAAQLEERMRNFWGDRRERLDRKKATDGVGPKTPQENLVRHAPDGPLAHEPKAGEAAGG